MRIVFMGSPDFAVPSLAALVAAKHDVVAVVTQPDRPKGRGNKVLMTAVKEYALAHDLPILQPNKVKTPEFVAVLQELQPDVIVVAAFGQFLSQQILDLPRYGCLNVHASLLPKYRGAAPIHYAILQGESESGVTIMQMDIGMDTGAMLAHYAVPIPQYMTMGELHDILKVAGAKLLLTVLDQLSAGTAEAVAQPGAEATYAHLLHRDIEKIAWQDTALNIHNKIRALNPWPGTYTILPNGKTLKIWCSQVTDRSTSAAPGTVVTIDKQGFAVATGAGVLQIIEVQPESKKRMAATIFCNGRGLEVGDVLSGK